MRARLGQQCRDRSAPLSGLGAVQRQDPVEVVDLMLHEACGEAVDVHDAHPPVKVLTLDADRDGSFDGDRHAVEAQAALVEDAQLGRARATKDKAEYEKFFELWKDADKDMPALVEARKEYEELA